MIQLDEHTFPKANLEAQKDDFHYLVPQTTSFKWMFCDFQPFPK